MKVTNHHEPGTRKGIVMHHWHTGSATAVAI